MRTTPTRRRRRGNNGAIESWTNEGDEPTVETVAVPTVTLPTHVTAALPDTERAADATPAAAGVLQRLEWLQAELERATQYGEETNIHLGHDYRTACSDVIKQFPALALSRDIDQRLWASWQRELAALETQLAAAGSNDYTRLKAEGEMKLRDALYVALRNYSALIQDVQAAASGDTLRLVHRLALAQAHVMYALEIHSASLDKSWRTPELYYERARRWSVAHGEPHFHLARVVLHDGRCAEALYHLVRSRIASVPFDSPGTLIDQFAHVSSLRENASTDTSMWVPLDRAVLAAVAPYYGQAQEFLAHRRKPRELTAALCAVLDAICGDQAASGEKDATVIAAGSMQIVRIIGLLIASACLKMEAVQSTGPSTADAVDYTIVHNPRVIELIVSVVSGMLHRVLSAMTSPLQTLQQKDQALQLMLPSITIAFAWLVKLSWREMVSETIRASCEQLSTMVLTGVIAGGFLAPHEDHSSTAVPLVEEVEFTGFKCYEGVIGTSTEGATAINATGLEDPQTDRELLQRRIVKFLSFVESFMTPRPAAAAVIASAVPSSPAVGADAAHQLNQLSIATASESTTNTTIDAVTSSARSSRASTGLRELWTPPKTTTTKSKAKNDTKASTASTTSTVTASPAPSVPERVVVLDAANIAMRHGLQRRFSCRGIQICAEYFIAQNDRVVAFLPDYCLDVDADGSFRRRVATAGGRGRRRETKCTITPDDRVLLEILVDSGVVVLTPAMDSDDLYCIHYARRHNAFVVTNDLFRDHISETDGPKARQTELRQWLQTQRISYTFVGDEFLPNPNSAYEKRRLTHGATP